MPYNMVRAGENACKRERENYESIARGFPSHGHYIKSRSVISELDLPFTYDVHKMLERELDRLRMIKY